MNFQERKTIRELREIAKRRGLVGYYKLRKVDLITAISKHGGGVMDLLDTPSNSIFRLKDKNIYILMHSQENKTIRELREIAKQRNRVGYYKLRKADLITAISQHGGGVTDNNEKKKKSICSTHHSPIMTNTKFLLRINTFHQQNNRV